MKTTFSVFILLLALNVNGSTPEEVARNYFEAFSRHDFVTMGHLYDDSREGKVYHDDIFLDLSVKETQSMWRMLLEKSDLELTYRILSIKGNEVTAHWEGNYTIRTPVDPSTTSRRHT